MVAPMAAKEIFNNILFIGLLLFDPELPRKKRDIQNASGRLDFSSTIPCPKTCVVFGEICHIFLKGTNAGTNEKRHIGETPNMPRKSCR